MVKRCSHWEGTKLWVLGDNAPESTDSRQFGAIAAKFVLDNIMCALGGKEMDQITLDVLLMTAVSISSSTRLSAARPRTALRRAW